MKGADLIFDNVRFTRGDFRLEADTGFPSGRLSVILGPSGCGKTTLLDLAAGFLQPLEGRILEGRQEVTQLPPEKRRVGVVFQDHALFPHMNLKRNIMFGPVSRRVDRKEASRRADKLLEMVRLKGYGSRRPASLSGGEKQRVSLARALAIEPDILLLDEPFSALDAALRRELRAEVRRIQRKTGITTLLVTHDQEEALALADNLAVMDRGRIIRSGSPGDLWSRPKDLFSALFLGRSTCLEVHRIEEGPQGGVKVTTSAGTLILDPESNVPEGPLMMVVRPDRMTITPEGPLQGVVAEAEYAGGYWRISLEASGPEEEIILESRELTVPEPGEQIRFGPEKSAVILLPAAGHPRR